MTELFFDGLFIGITKNAYAGKMMLNSALGGAAVGGAAGAWNSDPGRRFSGFTRGALLGGGIGAFGGHLASKNVGKRVLQAAEQQGVTGLNANNVSHAFKSPENFARVAKNQSGQPLTNAHFTGTVAQPMGWQQQANQFASEAWNPFNMGAVAAGAGLAGGTIGADNPYSRYYGYYPYSY